jgi:predicted Zn-dependent protease
MEETASTTEHEISFDDVLAYAIRFQQNGQLQEAEDLYRRLREVAPEDPRLLHYSGVLAHQQGRSEEAQALIERSLAIEPDQAATAISESSARHWGASTTRLPPTSGPSSSTRRMPMPTTTSASC